MQKSIDVKLGTLYDNLLIETDVDLSTLESNYYINKVCIAYSKLVCLNEICSIFYKNNNAMFAIEENKIKSESKVSFAMVGARNRNYSLNWFYMDNYDDVKIFFKLFDVYEMPKIYVKDNGLSFTQIGTYVTLPPRNQILAGARLLHDFNVNALKIEEIKHHSPPQYFVTALEDILKYLITYKRTEEIQKMEKCLKHQEYLYKDVILVKEIVSISKVLSDENVDGRIKVYVLNSLQMILNEQEKLHEEMGITPVITHIDFLV